MKKFLLALAIMFSTPAVQAQDPISWFFELLGYRVEEREGWQVQQAARENAAYDVAEANASQRADYYGEIRQTFKNSFDYVLVKPGTYNSKIEKAKNHYSNELINHYQKQNAHTWLALDQAKKQAKDVAVQKAKEFILHNAKDYANKLLYGKNLPCNPDYLINEVHNNIANKIRYLDTCQDFVGQNLYYEVEAILEREIGCTCTMITHDQSDYADYLNAQNQKYAPSAPPMDL
ncbi:MAG: hypothetical protein AB7R69_01940 [Candidatus Babeliales bacterium]